MQALFNAVRDACSARSWSRGVELSRAGAVIGEPTSTEELTLKVATQVGMAYATVTLWPDDADWICDCDTAEDACAHVAAAVIALRRAGEAGKAVPAPQAGPGRIGYRFSRHGQHLEFRRVVVRNGASELLEHSLQAVASGRGDAPAVVITRGDQAVERALGGSHQGRLARERVPGLLKALGQCTDVELDGQPVRTSAAPVLPQVSVTDQAHGFLLRLEPHPEVTEVFRNGVVLCGDTLRPVGESGLTARQRAELPEGRFYALDDVAELVTEVLPALRKRLPVQVRTTRLPDEAVAPPRVVIDSQRRGDTLELLPRLVYGDPPTAYVEAGRLVHVGGAVPRRDEAAERQLGQRLQTEFGLVPGRPARLTGEDAVAIVQRLRAWPGVLRGSGHQAFTLAPALAPRLRLEAGQFDLSFAAEGPGASGRDARGRVNAAVVLRAWQQGATMLQLPHGGWAPLPVDWLERFGPRVADLLAARDAAGRLPTCVLPDLARLCDDLEQPRPPEMARLQALVDDFDGVPTAQLPDDLRTTLRAYQRRGVDWLVLLRGVGLGALLADDMGLGKTVQTLCAVQGRTLVVAPTSVVHNWAEELRRFRPILRTAMYHGSQRQLDPDADVTLTTYAILRLDADVLAAQAWGTLVLDEAQTIKNPASQVTGAAYRLRAPFRIALSGTPVENRLEELWSLMHFLNPGLLGGLRDFQERYARPIAAGQAGSAARLRQRIKPFVLRRRKQDVAAELPPRTDVVLHCVLNEDERQVYEAVRAATRQQVVARLQAGGSVVEALEALLRLRQACCHAGLVPGQHADSSSKVTLLLETLEQIVAEDHKALVFSQWTTLLDRVEPHLRAAGLAFERLDGSTRDRAGVVRRFQAPTGPPVMLVSLRAGGLGLNLTAADHVFLLDPWWNPAVEEQAADRAHRLGQERPVLVSRLVAEDTIEERLLALQEHKRALANTALGDASQAASLSREDVLALLA